jgi:hypothetical protein
MSGFLLHSEDIQNNINHIVNKVIPIIDKNFVFISDTFLYNKLKTEKLYITRGLHFTENDALHFNIKIVGYSEEFHVYVSLDYHTGHYPFMLLFITDGDHTIMKISEYLYYINYYNYLLFDTYFGEFDVNIMIKYYKTLIRQNQELLKKNKDSVFREEKVEQKKGEEKKKG